MSIYERPTKSLMTDRAKEQLSQGQIFKKAEPVRWFAEHYPKIKSNTVDMHVEGMSVNNTVRKHHPSIKPGSGYDLFYKLGPTQFRLWVKESNLPPRGRCTGDSRTLVRHQCWGRQRTQDAAGHAAEHEFAQP